MATRKNTALGKDFKEEDYRQSGRHSNGKLVLTKNNHQLETKQQDGSRHRQVNNSRQSTFDSQNWRFRHSDLPSDSGATGWRRRNNAPIEFKSLTTRCTAQASEQIRPNVKFMDGEDVVGVRLLTDARQVYKIRNLLGENIKGPKNLFAAMWPVDISMNRLQKVLEIPYYVAPKPHGHRFMLYINPLGETFLENNWRNVFQLDGEHSFHFISRDGSACIDTVLDGVITRPKSSTIDDGNDDKESKPKLTFVVMDAVRYNGQDLTNMSVADRMACIKENIISPRREAIENDPVLTESEAFELDFVDYVKFSESECYMTKEFEDCFKYSLYCLIFVSQSQEYVRGTCWDAFLWKGEDDVTTFTFRLKIVMGANGQEEGELHLFGRDSENYFASIAVTDEIRQMNDSIIDCTYVDRQWIFKKLRNDRKYPNGHKTVQDKLKIMESPITRCMLVNSVQAVKTAGAF